jgi:hypothetical protein
MSKENYALKDRNRDIAGEPYHKRVWELGMHSMSHEVIERELGRVHTIRTVSISP